MKRERGTEDPGDVRRRRRGPAEGDVHLRRGRRPDRPEHRRTWSHAPGVARVPRLPGHLRDRDDQVRRRHPARLLVPREDAARSRTPSGASSSSRPRSSRPARRKTDFEILTTISNALGHEHGLRDAERRDGRDRRADAALRRRHLRAHRPRRAAVAGRAGRHRLADPLRGARSSCEGGRAHFAALPYKPPGDQADEEFPLILVTGRRLEHYNAGTMTRRTGNLELMSDDWLEIHPDDARGCSGRDGDTVAVRSKQGRDRDPAARVTERIEPGHVFTAFHFPEVRTNLLIGPSADVNTSCPEYKVVAVRSSGRGPSRRRSTGADGRRVDCTKWHRRRRRLDVTAVERDGVTRRGRRRGAAGDPRRRRAAGRDHAHARPRRGARARASSTARADRRTPRRG